MEANHMSPKDLQQISLLLVDDEDFFRQTLFKRLNKRGFQVKQAISGEEALSILETHLMDVVVMDVKMPGLDGLEVLNCIRQKHPKIEVILLTGHSAAPDGVKGIKLGAFDYLSKPIEFEHLLGKIQQAYEKKLREVERETEAKFKTQVERQMIVTERLAALGTLAAGVSHEINNPLAIINEAAGYLQVLLKKPELADMSRRKDFENALAKIIKGVKRARTITHQLLEGVRPHDSVQKKIDLCKLVAETVDLVRREASNKMIEIHQEPAFKLEPTWLDPNQIRQILINLLTNAIHASFKGGQINIFFRRTAKEITFAIHDTGKGIPKENMERIFEPFFSDKPPGEGTGLGLFITREIVKKLNGSLEVESKVGKGTTVTIMLPIQNNKLEYNSKMEKKP
jgi:two-component system, NtrC family, sensor kinase